MTSIQAKILSLEEFLKLPETKPASEYVDGHVYQKFIPQGKRSTIQGRLTAAINQIGIVQRSAYAFPELRCTFEGRSLVPDIAVFSWTRIPLDANENIQNVITTYPDWVIEILSPDQSPTRIIDKLVFCLNQGAELGWLIDPEEKIVLAFQANRLPISKEDPSDILITPTWIENWQLTVGELFGWLSFGREP
jgi:Uma2 family endonuclease